MILSMTLWSFIKETMRLSACGHAQAGMVPPHLGQMRGSIIDWLMIPSDQLSVPDHYLTILYYMFNGIDSEVIDKGRVIRHIT